VHARLRAWWHQHRSNRPTSASLRRLEPVLPSLARRAHGVFMRVLQTDADTLARRRFKNSI
jgi:hypothetical protein